VLNESRKRTACDTVASKEVKNMSANPGAPRENGWGKKIRAQFMPGSLITVSLGASILILFWVFTTIDHILQPLVRTI
jgi:hypothetical protein